MTRKSTTKEVVTSRKRGIDKVDRVPLDGYRDILTVQGKDKDYSYRWVNDKNEEGHRIMRFKQAGWEFVEATEVHVGQSAVYKSDNIGSIVRYSAGKGDYLYLMKIPKEWYDEDQAAKQERINDQEKSITRPRNPDNASDDGQYGQNKISFGS